MALNPAHKGGNLVLCVKNASPKSVVFGSLTTALPLHRAFARRLVRCNFKRYSVLEQFTIEVISYSHSGGLMVSSQRGLGRQKGEGEPAFPENFAHKPNREE